MVAVVLPVARRETIKFDRVKRATGERVEKARSEEEMRDERFGAIC